MMHDHRHIFVDIDGTLTDSPGSGWGEVHADRLEAVQILAKHRSVVLWSGRGARYAREFNERWGVGAEFAIGKPDMMIDDAEDIRGLKTQHPDTLLGLVERCRKGE